MSHNIELRNRIHSFAYSVRPGVSLPWHGVGQKHDGLMVVGEALNLSRVGAIEVDKVELQANGASSGVFGIWRHDINAPLAGVSVGEDYGVVQYAETMRDFASAAFGDARVVDTMGALGKGEKAFMTILGEVEEIRKDDPVQSYTILTTTHDGTGAVQWFGTDTRVVCQNTLRVAVDGARNTTSIRHTKNAQKNVDAAIAAMKDSRLAREVRIAAFKAMGDRELSVAEFRTFLDTMHPIDGDVTRRTINTRSRIQRLFEGAGIGSNVAGRTAWGAFQAITQSADENARGDQPWLTSLLNGTQNAYRQAAFDNLVALVG
jgi:phage/plasmid-like protein (TIGR03299 family)